MAHIQQHMYTREREGVFNSTPGYDTIAISKGLDKTFIKNVLHPLCSYYPPRELATAGEKDEGKYPKSRLITFTESGELILGQSVYKESDYTGERETFFSHNYIVPKDRVKDFLYSADSVFGKLPFETAYDVSNGKKLNELEVLPSVIGDLKSLNSILVEFSITSEQFKQLVFALITSLTSKKKVYISLPGDVNSVTEAAFQLTYYLFQCVPFELRKSFGFISYASEPQNKKNINLMFVEKGSIRPNDSLINKDFVFDFAQDIFMNSKESVKAHSYLQFAFDRLKNNSSNLTDFFRYAEIALYDQKNISLQHYNDLQTLYSIIEGSYNASEINNTAIFKILRQFLTADNFIKKEALSDTLVKLVDEESSTITTKQSPSTEEMILELLYFASFLNQEQIGKIVRYIAYSLHFGSSDHKYVSKIYKHLKGKPSLFTRVNSMIFTNQNLVKSIIEPYIRIQLGAITSLKSLVAEVKFWLQTNPEVIENPEFVDTSMEMFISLFQKEKDLLEAILTLKKDLVNPRVQDEGITYFYHSILKKLATLLINGVSLETMSRKQFEQASTIAKSISKDTSNENVKSKIELIHYVQEIMESRQLADPDRFHRYPNFGKLQSIILRLIKNSPIEEQTERIALCFYNSQHHSQNFNYNEMFTYVHSHDGTIAMLKFTNQFTRLWRSKYTRDPGLERALHQYISEFSKEIFKDKRLAKRWENIDPLVARIIKRVKYEQLSAFSKFLHKNSQVLFISLVSVLTLVIVVIGGLGIYNHLEEKKAVAAAAEEKKAKEKAMAIAIEEAKQITIKADVIDLVDRDDVEGVSNLDLLRIKSTDSIDLKNLLTVEKLVINFKEEKIIINNVIGKDIIAEDQTLKSVDLTITETNLAEVKDFVENFSIETIEASEVNGTTGGAETAEDTKNTEDTDNPKSGI
jgi:hypothetical protein